MTCFDILCSCRPENRNQKRAPARTKGKIIMNTTERVSLAQNAIRWDVHVWDLFRPRNRFRSAFVGIQTLITNFSTRIWDIAMDGDGNGASAMTFIGQKLLKISAFLLLTSTLHAFTQLTVSTAAPAGIEQQFIAATTNQFQAILTSNPLAANTYAIKLFGPNPNYQAPPLVPTTLEAALSLGSTVYTYGWANGMDYERTKDLNFFLALPSSTTPGGFFVNCSSPAYFNGIQYSSTTQQLVTIDTTTCNAVLSGVYNFIYQQFFSTPTAPTVFVP